MRKLTIFLLFFVLSCLNKQSSLKNIDCKKLEASDIKKIINEKKYNIKNYENDGIYSICTLKNSELSAIHFASHNGKINNYYFERN